MTTSIVVTRVDKSPEVENGARCEVVVAVGIRHVRGVVHLEPRARNGSRFRVSGGWLRQPLAAVLAEAHRATVPNLVAREGAREDENLFADIEEHCADAVDLDKCLCERCGDFFLGDACHCGFLGYPEAGDGE